MYTNIYVCMNISRHICILIYVFFMFYQVAIDLWTESIDLDNQNKAVVTKVIN
jgi:hypothetical protein